MSKKNDTTGTTTKTTSKRAADPKPAPKMYKKLSAVMNDAITRDLPRGAKFVICEKLSKLVTRTKSTETVHFEFPGTPADFAAAILKYRGIKAEIFASTASNPPSDSSEE